MLENLERTAKVYEKYNEAEERFEFVATCPFCKEHTKLIEGKITQKCAHYVRYGAGCGGTIFLFRKDKAAAVAA